MRILILFLFFIFPLFGLSQKDQNRYYDNGRLNYSVKQNGAILFIVTYSPKGIVLGEAECILESRYRPAGLITIYYPDSKLHFKYEHKFGELHEYDRSGNLIYEYKTSKSGETAEDFAFYTNGKLKTHRVFQKAPDENHWAFHPYDNRYKAPVLWLFSAGEAKLEEEFRPDGSLYSKKTGTSSEREYIYYTEEGRVDAGKYKKIVRGEKDKLHGVFYTWFSNGNIATVESYFQGLKTGNWKTFYENGAIRTENMFLNGEEAGVQSYYHQNGVRISWKTVFVYGGRGPEIGLHPNGKLHQMGTESDFGFTCVYDSTGVQIYEKVPAIPGGQWPYYIDKEKCRSYTFQGEFKNNLRDGEWKIYSEGRNLFATINYSMGVLHGESKLYDSKGKVLLSCNYKLGMLSGPAYKMFLSSPSDTAFSANYYNGLSVGHRKSWRKPGQMQSHYYYTDSTGRNMWYMAEYNEQGKLTTQTQLTDSGRVITSYYPQTGSPYSRSVYRNGNKNPDTYSFYESGYLSNSKRVIDDKSDRKFVTMYYPNGERSITCYTLNGKDDGERRTYYENGKIRSKEMRRNGLTEGEVKFYDEFGRVKTTREYEAGMEVVNKAELKNNCQCSTEFKPTGQNSFFYTLRREIPLENVNKGMMRFQIDTNYNGVFVRNSNKGSGHYSASLILYARPKLILDKSIELSLNPCKNLGLHTELEISGSKTNSRSVGIEVSDGFSGTARDYFGIYFNYYELDELHRLKKYVDAFAEDSIAFKKFIFSEFGVSVMTLKNSDQSEALWSEIRRYYKVKGIDDNYVLVLDDFTTKLFQKFLAKRIRGKNDEAIFTQFFSNGESNRYLSVPELRKIFNGKTEVTIDKGYLGIKMSEAFFDNKRSDVEFPLVIEFRSLKYTNDPYEKITIDKNPFYNWCVPVFTLRKANMEMKITSFDLDLDAIGIPDFQSKPLYNYADFPFHAVRKTSGRNGEHQAYIPDNFLSQFMGVFFNATAKFVTNNKSFELQFSNCLVNSQELTGTISCSEKDVEKPEVLAALLKERGFDIHEQTRLEQGRIVVFFRLNP